MHISPTRSLIWVLQLVTHQKPTTYFYGYKQCYIHSSLDVVLCLPLHIHDGVENVLKHVLFYVHDVKVMAEHIALPIRKLQIDTSICTRPVLELLPQTVNVRVDAPLSKKNDGGNIISSLHSVSTIFD